MNHKESNRIHELSEEVNLMYQKKIDKIGIDKFLKELKDTIKKNNIAFIKDSYEHLKKDMELAPYSGANDSGTEALINTIKGNQNDLPIFEIEDDDDKYDIEFPIVPFEKFFIATNICEQIGKELYSINGFFVLDYDSDFLLAIYYWNRSPGDGWGFSSFLMRKKELTNYFDEDKVGLGEIEEPEISKKIKILAMKKFANLMKKLIYKINKREYSTYKKYSYGNYIQKEIIFEYDVRTHMRHFWKDSGRFKIPLMSKEELKEKGYGVHELVLKDGKLRKDVPFTLIGEFRVGQVKKEENKVYDMIEKRHFRQEEKLFKILRELYPDNFIKRHDRKVLKGLELDFLIRDLRLAFEYDGYQHYEFPNVFHKTKEDFEAQKQRDRKKTNLCKRKKIILIRIRADEPLTKTYVKRKIKRVII